MKSIQIEKFGGPEVLVIKDIDIGKPGPKEVLIKNKSIGLNFIDVYHRTGLYPIPLPSGIGLEASGVIEEIGSESTVSGSFQSPVICGHSSDSRNVSQSNPLSTFFHQTAIVVGSLFGTGSLGPRHASDEALFQI